MLTKAYEDTTNVVKFEQLQILPFESTFASILQCESSIIKVSQFNVLKESINELFYNVTQHNKHKGTQLLLQDTAP